MIVEIQKSRVLGRVKAPASKSYTHRGIILASLTGGKSKIISPLSSEDTEATLDCLRKLGIKIKKEKNLWEVDGGNLGRGLTPSQEPLFCRESGTTLRLMTAICALIKGKCVLTGKKSLMRRPIKPLLSALEKLGVKCVLKNNSILQLHSGLMVSEVEPSIIIDNNFIGGRTEIRGDISSQFISALLLIAPFAEKEVEIKLTTPLESKPYLLMTIEAQKKFGVKVEHSKDLKRFLIKKQNYKPTEYVVEGDWSSAAPFLVAGAIAGKVAVENLNLKSRQADKKIVEVLKKAGGGVKVKGDSILAEKSTLSPLKFNIKECPDLFPIICVLAAVANGRSEISGIERLKFKESNRLEEMRKGLKEMGIKAYTKEKRFFIEGGAPQGGVTDSAGGKDHRIAMAFAILGLAAEGKTIIKNAECVSKSFPDFFEVLGKLIKK